MKLSLNKRLRLRYSCNEIFSTVCDLFNQTKYTNRAAYFRYVARLRGVFFSQLRNRCLLSGCSRSVFSRLRLSRHAFLSKTMESSLTGFFHAVW